MRNRFGFALLFCLGVCMLYAQTTESQLLVRISLEGRAMSDLARLGVETDHGEFRPGRFLSSELSETELRQVQDAGFQTQIIVPDMMAWYRAQKQQAGARSQSCNDFSQQYTTPANYSYGSMGGYQTLDEILAVIDDMKAKFPNLISARKPLSDTLTTQEGRPIWYLKISDHPDLDEDEPEVLYTALHHAREPNSMSQMLFFMWYLLENYPTDPEVKYIVENEELYFIPCVNPDGYVYNEVNAPNGGGGWRKNRRDNGGGIFGVDLNRNYGYFWGSDDLGSSPDSAAGNYRGPGPFSEPETQMIRNFSQDHDFVLACNYHSYGNLLIYPWAYSDTPADSAFVKLGRLFARDNRYTFGTTGETVGYAVNGGSDDYLYAASGTWSFTPEIGVTGFWPLPGEIDALNKANLWQNRAVALAALRFGVAKDRSPDAFVQTAFEFPVQLTRYGNQNGPLTMSLAPLSSNIASVSGPQIFDLQHFEDTLAHFSVQLSPSIQNGEDLRFLLQVYNGFFTQSDTLIKTFGNNTSTVWTEPGTNTSNWTGDWGTTNESYVSAPSSITDSPGSNYPSNAYTLMTQSASVQIPADAVRPQLRFWARWDIEKKYDFAQVQGIGSNGQAITLCGRYTADGTYWQDINNPVYDGLQNKWVEECIDLSAFTGQDFAVQFLLASDGGGEFDGFYFDDLRIIYADPFSVTTHQIPLEQFQIRQNQPNPARDYTIIQWTDKTDLPWTNLLIFNLLGEKMIELPLDASMNAQARIETKGWQPGVYTYFLRSPEMQSVPMKMAVIK